jgi:hypothetical protein
MLKHHKPKIPKAEKPTVKIEIAFYAFITAIFAGIIAILAIIGGHTAQMVQMLELILQRL